VTRIKRDKPLHCLDNKNQTYGCRHSNPDICSKHDMPGVCAFVKQDNICTRPPLSWGKIYKKLKEDKNAA